MDDNNSDHGSTLSDSSSDNMDYSCSADTMTSSDSNGVRHRKSRNHEEGEHYRADLERMTSMRNFSLDVNVPPGHRVQRSPMTDAPNTSEEPGNDVGQSEKACMYDAVEL